MRSASLLRVPKTLRALSEDRGPAGSPLRIWRNELFVGRLNLPRVPQRARALRHSCRQRCDAPRHACDGLAIMAALAVVSGPRACRGEAELEHAATTKIGKRASEVSASTSDHAFELSRVSSVALSRRHMLPRVS